MPGIIDEGQGLAFKSTRENYAKERSGDKANTVRFMAPEEARTIEAGLLHGITGITHIEVWEVDGPRHKNRATGQFIRRTITDVTPEQVPGSDLACFIFSWDSREA